MSALISQAEDLSSLQTHYVRHRFFSSNAEDLSSLQGRERWSVTVSPQAPLSMSYRRYLQSYRQYLQTQEYRHPNTDDRDMIRWISAFEQYFSWRNDAQQQLEEIRQEAEEASVLDNEIEPVPDSAYDDADSLLKIFSYCNVPMPDIGWAEDGSLGFEWRPENGIVTMGVYGDNHVIYGAFFHDKRQVEGICALSDTNMLRGFLMMFLNLLF